MSTVSPIQSKTYQLVVSNDVITFGAATRITLNAANSMGVYGNTAAVWNVTNQGLISSVGSGSDGLSLVSGAVTNQSTGSISGNYIGVYIAGSSSSVSNVGKISADQGVVLGLSGQVNNGAGGVISGIGVNGAGASLRADSSLNNAAGGTITGTHFGVFAIGPQESLSNAGVISGVGATGVGVYLQKGGALTNQGNGVISGTQYGAQLDASSSYSDTLANSGRITGLDGVLLQGQGAAATNNAGGTISGTQAGVMVSGTQGSVTNAGTISGGAFGVFTAHGASVTDTGVITGSTAAVEFTGTGTSTLTLGTGAVLNGAVIGSTTGQNFLNLVGQGVASNTFENFNKVTVAGSWELTGASTIGAAAVTSIASGQLQIGDASHGSAQLVVNGDLTNRSALVVGGGLLDVKGTVRGGGAVSISGGVAEFDGAFEENVKFTGSGGTLRMGASQAYAGGVTGFSAGNKLDLADVAFVGANEATFAGNTSSGTLTVNGGSTQAKITLFGNYMASTFSAQSDGHGGTLVSVGQSGQSHALVAPH